MLSLHAGLAGSAHIVAHRHRQQVRLATVAHTTNPSRLFSSIQMCCTLFISVADLEQTRIPSFHSRQQTLEFDEDLARVGNWITGGSKEVNQTNEKVPCLVQNQFAGSDSFSEFTRFPIKLRLCVFLG